MLLKTPSLKKGEYEVKFECDELFMTLRDVASILSKADYSLEKAIN